MSCEGGVRGVGAIKRSGKTSLYAFVPWLSLLATGIWVPTDEQKKATSRTTKTSAEQSSKTLPLSKPFSQRKICLLVDVNKTLFPFLALKGTDGKKKGKKRKEERKKLAVMLLQQDVRSLWDWEQLVVFFFFFSYFSTVSKPGVAFTTATWISQMGACEVATAAAFAGTLLRAAHRLATKVNLERAAQRVGEFPKAVGFFFVFFSFKCWPSWEWDRRLRHWRRWWWWPLCHRGSPSAAASGPSCHPASWLTAFPWRWGSGGPAPLISAGLRQSQKQRTGSISMSGITGRNLLLPTRANSLCCEEMCGFILLRHLEHK